MSSRRKIISFVLANLLILLSLEVLLPSKSSAEECPTIDPGKVFVFGYTPLFPTWTNKGESRVIKWAALEPGEFLNGKAVQVSFGTKISWLREAFNSWDDALDSISFLQVKSSESPDIRVGFTNILELDRVSLFNVWPDIVNPNRSNIRNRATIEFKYDASFLYFKENFMQSAQFEIAQILGLGIINPSSDLVSIVEYPWQPPYSQIPLSDFDIALVRSLYGESTCPSSFPMVYQLRAEVSRIKSQLSAASQQVEDLQKSVIAEQMRTKAAVDEIAKRDEQINSLARELTDLKQKIVRYEARLITTISCTNGKVTTKVTGLDPVCPKGYKRR